MKSKYLTSAMWLILSGIAVKLVGAFYKIPLTVYIGAVGRGYFAAAYNLYMPVHAVIMGAFPIALSRLVSKYSVSENSRMLLSLRKGAFSLFLLIGSVSMLLLIAFAKPYAVYIASSPKSIYTILVLSPTILFSCLSAVYRGYFEGKMNMLPTAVSQTLEAVFKLAFGLLFARGVMMKLFDGFEKTGNVLSKAVSNENEALSLIYPYSTAAAMLGVTLGGLVSLLFLLIYDKINCDIASTVFSRKEGRRELIAFSTPIMLSCAVQSVFQFLDTASIQRSLSFIDREVLLEKYALSGASEDDIVSYVFGIFSTSLDFKNLIPGITMALGVTCVPAICRLYEQNRRESLEKLVCDVFKYTSLLSVMAGFLLYVTGDEILSLFYSSSEDIVFYSSDIVKYFSLTAPVYSLASTAVFTVQAIGCPEKSVKGYVLSGIIRIALNILLIRNENLILFGAVISGAAGYFVLFIQNIYVLKKETGLRIKPLTTLIKPLIIGQLSVFSVNFAILTLNDEKFFSIYLLIKTAVFLATFCILCFFFKMLDLNNIILILKSKKNGLNT